MGDFISGAQLEGEGEMGRRGRANKDGAFPFERTTRTEYFSTFYSIRMEDWDYEIPDVLFHIYGQRGLSSFQRSVPYGWRTGITKFRMFCSTYTDNGDSMHF